MKLAHKISSVRIDKATRLFHINFLNQRAMKKGIEDVKLANGPLTMHSQSKDKPDSGRLNNGTKSLRIVNAELLLKSFVHEASFKPFHRAISMSFDLIDPFVVDNMSMRGSRTKGPGIVGNEGLKFCTHGSSPTRISSSLAITSRLNVREDIMKTEEGIPGMEKFETGKLFGFKRACVRSGSHRE